MIDDAHDKLMQFRKLSQPVEEFLMRLPEGKEKEIAFIKFLELEMWATKLCEKKHDEEK